MISHLLFALQKAVHYVKKQPQILFALMLLIGIPLLFLYTGQQFLDVGKANQDRLQKDRIGLMHDTLTSLLSATDFNVLVAQKEFDHIIELNPDIVDYKILEKKGAEIIPLAALHTEFVGVPEPEVDLYRSAALRVDESIIFEYVNTEHSRIWSTYRAIENVDGHMYFIYMQVSMKTIDSLFKTREQSAYFSLVFIYCFLIALAYWHIRLTNYKYLYVKSQKDAEMKDLFTNMIAHELRAPLTAIRGYATMIEEKTKDAEELKYAHRVNESAERLINIVNDLLDVARIQSGKLTVTIEEFDASSVVKAVIDELQISAVKKNIELKQEGTALVHLVSGDKKRLHQALINLLSNALKYTPEGIITIAVEEKHAFVEVRVKDTGMGISSANQKKLFAPFFRVASDDVSKITGTGLGMWITKQLIELMGAKIAVESIKGVGTHVVVTLMKNIRIS